MRKAIIICILSLSLCLSQAAPPADDNAAKTSTPNETKINGKEAKAPVTIITTENPSPAPKKTPTESTPAQPADAAKTEKPQETTPSDKTKTEIKPNTNKTEITTETSKSGEATKTEATTAKVTDKPANTTEADAGKATTPNPVTVQPTEAPKAVTEKPLQAARGFDGPSFIGGIILTLGLLAIGFMGFKYYKNQTERNYHTL